MKLARSTFYYRAHRAAAEKLKLRDRIISLCEEFPRYGYRRITAQLRKEGTMINHKTGGRGGCGLSYSASCARKEAIVS